MSEGSHNDWESSKLFFAKVKRGIKASMFSLIFYL